MIYVFSKVTHYILNEQVGVGVVMAVVTTDVPHSSLSHNNIAKKWSHD